MNPPKRTKYIIFSSVIYITMLSSEGVNTFLDEAPPYFCMALNEEPDYTKAFKKIEKYGSFMFVNKRKFEILKEHCDGN